MDTNNKFRYYKKRDDILRLISGDHALALKALDGSRLIYKAKNTFASSIDSSFVNWGLNKNGIATPQTMIRVDEMTGAGGFVDIFQSLHGTWNQKWVSQNQVIEFCEGLPNWLRQAEVATMFLCKKDEYQPVDENKPQDNLVVVRVFVLSNDLVGVNVRHLENIPIWRGGYRRRIVSPEYLENYSIM